MRTVTLTSPKPLLPIGCFVIGRKRKPNVFIGCYKMCPSHCFIEGNKILLKKWVESNT